MVGVVVRHSGGALTRRGALALAVAAATAVAVATTAPSAAHAAAGVSYTCSPAPEDCSGWYRTPVRLVWSVPSDYDTEGCDNQTYTADTPGTANRCRATNGVATFDTTVTIRVDRTPPEVTGAAPERPPDSADWYTAPVLVGFAGTDATSGVATCTSLTYSGPDADPAGVPGSCTDVAGNESAPFTLPLRFDATPPALQVTRTAGDRRVALRWTASPDAVRIFVTRNGRSVFNRAAGTGFTDRHARNGRRYVYQVTAVDAAGNAAVSQIMARPARRLLSPARAARVDRRPVLRWTPVRKARYYNVQLFRDGRKVLSRWPLAARYHLPRLHR
jgi:hypothetical protein